MFCPSISLSLFILSLSHSLSLYSLPLSLSSLSLPFYFLLSFFTPSLLLFLSHSLSLSLARFPPSKFPVLSPVPTRRILNKQNLLFSLYLFPSLPFFLPLYLFPSLSLFLQMLRSTSKIRLLLIFTNALSFFFRPHPFYSRGNFLSVMVSESVSALSAIMRQLFLNVSLCVS